MASGFHHAPVTKLVMALTAGASVLAASTSLGALMGLDSRDQVVKAGQAWRLASSVWPAPSVAGGLVVGYLLYRFRTFERQMGSGRYSLFLLLATAWAVGARAAWVYGGVAPAGLSSGPLEPLFALFVYFYRAVPKLRPSYFSLGGLRFSDKSMTYAVGLQLALSDGRRSLLPALAGLLFGAVYMADALRLQRLRWPGALRACCRRTLLPVLDGGGTTGSAAGANGPASRGRAGGARRRVAATDDDDDEAVRRFLAQAGVGGGNAAAAAAAAGDGPVGFGGLGAGLGAGGGGAAIPVDPAAVDRLVGALGFPRDAVERALRESFGDENAAANRLLGG